jgi:hypothetical protein
LSIIFAKELSEKPKSIAEYNLRKVGLPYVLKYTGNGAIIVTGTTRKCWYLVKSSSRLLQNTSSNPCCHWIHIFGKFFYRTFSTKAQSFLEKEWKNRATVPVNFFNFQKNCGNRKRTCKKSL